MVFHTRTAIEYRTGAAAPIAPSIVGVETRTGESNERRRLAAERALDEVLAESFPASDPPSWTPGIVRPSPGAGLESDAERSKTTRTSGSDILDVSRPSRDRTILEVLGSIAGAAGIALLVPFAILLVGLPVVLAVRGGIEVIGWLFGAGVQ